MGDFVAGVVWIEMQVWMPKVFSVHCAAAVGVGKKWNPFFEEAVVAIACCSLTCCC